MSDKTKNYLGIAIIVVMLMFGFAALSYVSSYSNYVDSYSKSIQPSSFRSFSVSGEGKVVAIPDVAQFTFSVITEGGKNIANLQKENSEKVNKAIEFVKANKVEAKDIKTQNYNLTPRYQYYSCPRTGGSCPPPEIVGYTITQTVLVKVRDFNKIGDIVVGVVQNGANSVSELSFTIDDPTKVENQARAEAINKAKEKAKDVAKAGDFRVGRLLSIQEGYIQPFYTYKEMAPLGLGGGGEPSVPPIIEPGSQEVTVSVTLTYEIE